MRGRKGEGERKREERESETEEERRVYNKTFSFKINYNRFFTCPQRATMDTQFKQNIERLCDLVARMVSLPLQKNRIFFVIHFLFLAMKVCAQFPYQGEKQRKKKRDRLDIQQPHTHSHLVISLTVCVCVCRGRMRAKEWVRN